MTRNVERILHACVTAIVFGLVGCDSGTSSGSGAESQTSGSVAKTLTVGSDAMVPIVGGYHEPRYAFTRQSVPDTTSLTTLNFLGSTQDGKLKYVGSILVNRISLGSFTVDTSNYAYRTPGAVLSFFRHHVGEDTCYYSAMSGNLQITGWKETTLNGSAGHLVSAKLQATMGFPWTPKGRKTCPETVNTSMEFTEAFVKTYED